MYECLFLHTHGCLRTGSSHSLMDLLGVSRHGADELVLQPGRPSLSSPCVAASYAHNSGSFLFISLGQLPACQMATVTVTVMWPCAVTIGKDGVHWDTEALAVLAYCEQLLIIHNMLMCPVYNLKSEMLQNVKLLSVNIMPQVKKWHAMKMYSMNSMIRMAYVYVQYETASYWPFYLCRLFKR